MSRLNRVAWRGAIVGVIAAAGSLAAAGAVTAATTEPPGAAASGAASGSLDLPIPPLLGGQGDGSQECFGSAFDLGPFGPLGPWGPYGPLHSKPHPACVGGGPDYNK